MKKLIPGIICLCMMCVRAQTRDEKWNVGGHGGLAQYNGDLGNGWYSTHQAYYGLGGISVSRYINDRIDASFFGTYGELGYLGQYTVVNDRPLDNNFRIRLATGNFLLRYHLVSRESVVGPYVFGGVSAMNQQDRSIVRTPGSRSIDLAFPTAGGGLIFRFGPIISLQLQEMFMYTWADDVDHHAQGMNDMYLLHSIGLTFNLGKLGSRPMGSRAGGRIDKCDDMCKNPKKDKGHISKTKARVKERKTNASNSHSDKPR
jgi:hypothetical protein